MPPAKPFDTLDYARKLQSAGVPAAQAEVQASALGEAFAGTVASPADMEAQGASIRAEIASTRADLEAQGASIRAEIAATRADLDMLKTFLNARIDALGLEVGGKIDTLRWMLGVVVALNAAVFVQTFLRQ
jgi:hypothetical protein